MNEYFLSLLVHGTDRGAHVAERRQEHRLQRPQERVLMPLLQLENHDTPSNYFKLC